MPKRGKHSKAAWRALEDARENARASASAVAAALPNDALFYIDTADGGGAQRAGSKRDKARARGLKIDAACAKARAETPYPVPVAVRAGKMFQAPPSRAKEATRSKGDARRLEAARGAALTTTTTTKGVVRGTARDGEGTNAFDVWGAAAPKARGINKLAKKLTAPPTTARAVAPEHPGCSFNPPKDAREDVVAVALAKEFKEKQAKYLNPVVAPVSNNVAEANLVNELYFESGFGDDETDEDDGGGGGGGGAEVDADGKSNRAVTADKFSKTKRNKLKRRAEAEAQEEANRKAKQLRRDLSNLKALKSDIAAEEAERDARLARRRAVREERRQAQPARLGKLRHKEELVAVRFADELDGGSLRTLKGGASLLRDRLKSYERREIIEPRRKVERQVKGKAVIKYEPGARGERETELHNFNREGAKKIAELRALVADPS